MEIKVECIRMNDNFLEHSPGRFLIRVPQVQRNADGSISPAELMRIAGEFQSAYDAAIAALERGDGVKFQPVGDKATDEMNLCRRNVVLVGRRVVWIFFPARKNH